MLICVQFYRLTFAATDVRLFHFDAIFAARGFDFDFLQQAEKRFADARAQCEIRARVRDQNSRHRTSLAQRGFPLRGRGIGLEQTTLLRVAPAMIVGVIVFTFFAVRCFHHAHFITSRRVRQWVRGAAQLTRVVNSGKNVSIRLARC